MDFVIVDYDCRWQPAEKTRIRELLGMPEDREVLYLEEADWEEKGWEIPECAAGGADRCVFLTCLTGGIKRYHRDIFAQNPQIRSWVIAVLDVERESYQKQLLAGIDQAFCLSEAYYEIVFDSSGSLRETGKRCLAPAKTRKRCLVVSGNRGLAEQVGIVIGEYLSSWEIFSCEITSAEDYRFADAVIVVGEELKELAVPAPAAGIHRRYVWLNRRFPVPGEYEELAEAAGEIINDCGWNLPDYRGSLYCSDLVYERLYRQIENGEIGYSALKEQDDFVMWDVYGLPAVRQDYTAERIACFLEQNCCFAKIKERIVGKAGEKYEVR